MTPGSQSLALITPQEVNQMVARFEVMSGWCVIPIKYRTKKAGIYWEQYQEKRPSREQVEAWFSDGKDHNIGIITGQVSGGLVVLVFNQEKDFGRFFEGMDILEQTPVVRTPRGYHIYLHVEERVESHIYGKGRFEVKGEGAYVVTPPSMHPSGVEYQWITPSPNKRKVIAGITDFPNWVKDRALRIGINITTQKPRLVSSMRFHITPETMRPRYAREPVPEGERNVRAFKVACYFFKHYRRELAEKRIVRWAHKFCENFPDESFTQKDLEATIESAYKTVTGGKR
jgi:hypothetical protein